MSTDIERVQNGYSAYQNGDLDTARSWLQGVNNPQALHLLGLVERRAGQFELAIQALTAASNLDPRNHEIANNQGRVALDMEAGHEAENHFRRALSLRANWLPAIEGLARSLNAQRRWHDAVPLWQHLLTAKPDSVGYQYGAAMAGLETGAVEAAAKTYDALLAAGSDDPAIWFMRSRARLELGDIKAGKADLRTAWTKQPSPHVLRNLANVLWMSGDSNGFYDLLASAPDALGLDVITLLREADDEAAALRAWDALSTAEQQSTKGAVARALLAIDATDLEVASLWAERAVTQAPADAGANDVAITTRLMCGDGEAALKLILPQRQADPHNQHWIAHQATALRLCDPVGYAALVQLDQHVRTYTLPVPTGYTDLPAFNQALAHSLNAQRGFSAHPLDQSLKLGDQTTRDLATTPDPVVQAYIRALDAPIRSYLYEIGNAPDHPLTARNTGDYRFNGCWSVKLAGGGRHVNHVHPEGWISSAYYVCVPEGTAEREDRAGWIKFGEPPFTTTPISDPQKWVAPQAGRLVLFPSYLWHGTAPTLPGTERVTAPFDIVPT